MRETRLDNLASDSVGLAPIAERPAETMGHCTDAVPAQKARQRRVRKHASGQRWKDQATIGRKPAGLVEDLTCAHGERYTECAPRPDALARHRPRSSFEIHLVPTGTANLLGAGGGQNEKLEGELRRCVGIGAADRRDSASHSGVGKRAIGDVIGARPWACCPATAAAAH